MRPPKAAPPTSRLADMIRPDACSDATCAGMSLSAARWESLNSEYREASAAGTFVPAGAMLPGAGYDEPAGCPDAPSGPNATSTATAMRASATAPAAIEVARLVAGTRSESGTGTIG